VFARFGPAAVAGILIALSALLGATVVLVLDRSLSGVYSAGGILVAALLPLFFSWYWGRHGVPATDVPATNAELEALWNPVAIAPGIEIPGWEPKADPPANGAGGEGADAG
jgi:hypothetical protein